METQFIKLNMTPTGVNPCFHVSQYDIGRSLGFIVYNGSEVVDLDSYACTIEATRSDGVAITASVATDDNVGTFETTATMTNKADKYKAQFVIVDENSKRIASLPFDMDVVKAAMDENAESIEEDASLYQQYTDAVQGAIAEANADIQAEENARIAAVNAEATARANADTTLQNNIDAEATARANAITAEVTARQNADNTLQGNINSEASTRASADSNLQSQINQIIAPSGEAPSAAEVQNARIGADGVTYSTLGEAIRANDNELKSAFNESVNHFYSPISGKYIDITGSTTDFVEHGSNSFNYVIIDCSPLDVFTMRGAGSSDPGFLAFTDNSGNILQKYNGAGGVEQIRLIAPASSTKLIVNFITPDEGWICKGDLLNSTVDTLAYDFDKANGSKVDTTALNYDYMCDLNVPSYWETNGINSSTGVNTSASGQIRTKGFLPEGIEYIKLLDTASSGQRFILFAYTTDGAFEGCYTVNGLSKSDSARLTEIDFSAVKNTYPNHIWRISMYSGLTLADYADIGFFAESREIALLSDLHNIIEATAYGIRINTDGTVERIGNAVGKINDYVVGNSFVGSGVNNFDDIYPWSEIKTCNISENATGDKIITYEGQTGFSRTGSNGSVYVEIPKFFTKRYFDDDGNEIILISGTRHGGFVVEPAFFDSETGKEIEHIYVGAYLTQTGINAMNSLSGVFPESNVSLETFRTRSGEMYDFVTLQAIQKLMSIEFGRIDFSEIFGGFSYLPWSSSVRADGSVANTNTGNFKGDVRIANIGVGNTVSVASSAGQVQNRTITAVGEVTQVGGGYYRSITFDGTPVDLVDDTTILYCTGQKTGFTDALAYHTGRTNLNSGSTYSNQFRYRGIEGLWGTLGEILNGIIVKDLKAYWSNIKTDYNDITKYKRFNFPVPLQNTYTNSANPLPPQIKKMGWDFRYPSVAFPEVLAVKSEQYYGDLFFSINTTGPDGQTYPVGTEFIGISSMAWDGHEGNGLYTLRFWEKADTASWLYGSRAIIRNLR